MPVAVSTSTSCDNQKSSLDEATLLHWTVSNGCCNRDAISRWTSKAATLIAELPSLKALNSGALILQNEFIP